MEGLSRIYYTRGEPEKTEREIRITTIEIDESDYAIIAEAMKSLKVRCGQNATSALKGYRSAGSLDRSEAWKKKANDIDDLMSRIGEEMN